jgi:transposase
MRYMLSKEERIKETIIKSCEAGEMTNASAATRLGLSVRQIRRMKARYREAGGQSMLHGNCGRQPAKTLSIEIKQKILEIRKQPEFETVNTKHYQEILESSYGIEVSYTFLSNLFKENGIKSHRKHKPRKAHRRRERREHFGELLQADASPFRYFKGDDKMYSLHGFIDDATGKITGLYMCEHECMHGYFEVTKQTIKNFGVPESLYADGSSIFFTTSKQELSIEDELAGVMLKTTQYGGIMRELGVNLIHARSSQAKGRVERLWGTLQDRLVVEFAIAGVTNMEQANEFLAQYIKRFNEQFGVEATSEQSYFVPVTKGVDLSLLFSVKYDRLVDNGNCFSLNSITFRVEKLNCLPKTKVKVLINKAIGVKVMHNNKLYPVTPIVDKNRKTISSSDSIDMIISSFVYYHCLKDERAA